MTDYVEYDGGRIAYDDNGAEGPLVVCVPGLGNTRTAYRFLAADLAESGFRVVTCDLRGTGESSAGEREYGQPALAGDLRALVRHLDAGPAFVVAHSNAAGAAVVAAAAEAELFDGLVLVAPFARAGAGAGLRAGRFVRSWTRQWAGLFPAEKPDEFPEWKKELTASLKEPGHLAALRAMIGAGAEAAAAALPGLTVPVQVVMGGMDALFGPDPLTEAEWIGEQTRGEVVLIDTAGHYPMLDRPSEVTAAVVPFLARVASRRFA
ncbi:alpha/beta fold hydrolase [Streptomyces sp. NRRL S-87]|uniref:alpha/beta fold hydrolase n=1 Tax=Streptomyces sp. NRRL S-87 TaxID=1463920 RepID=UPI0004BF624D|nr:alpha/beta hydrolase [Streptomyces sp. NRRL S-87]